MRHRGPLVGDEPSTIGAEGRVGGAIVAELFDVPISIVSVVDTDRIWFKSHHGLPGVVLGW